MSQLAEIENIEKKYPVEEIKYKNFQVWPIFKYYFSSLYISKLGPVQVNGVLIKSFINYLFYGFFNIFRRYDYLIFSISNQRKLINGQFVDKNVDLLAQKLGKTLVIETPATRHYKRKDIPTKYIISRHLIFFFIVLYSKIFLRKLPVENEHYLQEILTTSRIDFDYIKIIKRHIAQYKIISLILKIYRPKAVFVVCSYVNFGFIKAFKDKGIKVIELQHGIISKSHSAYNVFKKTDQNFYPDYLLTFGKKEKEVFKNNNYFIPENNVLTLGHYYIDHILNNYKDDERFRKLKNNFKKIIAITEHGMEIDQEVIKFIKSAAQIDKSLLYVYIPRYDEYNIKEYSFPENIIIVNWLNTYEIISQCDFHTTVFSTCAMEAPSLGTQNILININQLSSIHYGTILTDKTITRVVNTPQEYVDAINTFKIKDRSEIINSNSDIVVPNYSKNLNLVLKQILQE